MNSRLRTALALVLALALVGLVSASGSLFGSSAHVLGTTSPSASASLLDDDLGDGVFAVVPQPLLVALLLFAVALVAAAVASPSGTSVGEPRRARAPPYR